MNCKSVEEINVPDGVYEGTWGGWQVVFTKGKFKGLSFRVNQGIRTPNAPVKITVINKKASVELN